MYIIANDLHELSCLSIVPAHWIGGGGHCPLAHAVPTAILLIIIANIGDDLFPGSTVIYPQHKLFSKQKNSVRSFMFMSALRRS